MKKRFNYNIKFLLLTSLAITIIFMIPFYFSSVFNAQDLTFHLSRIDGVLTCIQDRQLPFAIYPFKNSGYGYASPLFYCDIFFLIPSILYKIGFSLIISYKIFMFIITFLGAFIFNYTVLYITQSKKLSLFSSIIWCFSSYRILDIFIRGAVGEYLALNFLPLLVLSIYKIFVENKDSYILLALSFSLILFSHNITFVISVIVFAFICLFYIKDFLTNKKLVFTILKSTVLAICLCSFYIFPMIEQMISQEFIMNSSLGKMLENGFHPLRLLDDFIFQNIKYDISHPLQYTFVLGLIPTVFIPLAFFNKDKSNKNKFIKRISVICIILLIFSTNITFIPKMRLFGFMQFPWRVFALITTLSPLILSTILDNHNLIKEIILTISLTFIFLNTTSVYLTVASSSDLIPNDESYESLFIEQKYKPYGKGVFYNISELGGGEYLPNSHEFNYEKMGQCISYPNYDAAICDYYRNGTTIKFDSNLNYEERLLMPLSYYKGYKVFEIDHNDGSVIKQLETKPDDYSKRVSFVAEKGIHHYLVEYKSTHLQKISLLISFASLIFIIFNSNKSSKIKMALKLNQHHLTN